MSNNDEITKPRKVALYKDVQFGTILVFEFTNWEEQREKEGKTMLKDYVRISDPLEVQFSPASEESQVFRALKALDEQEREAHATLTKALVKINDMRGQLQALTYQPQTDSEDSPS